MDVKPSSEDSAGCAQPLRTHATIEMHNTPRLRRHIYIQKSSWPKHPTKIITKNKKRKIPTILGKVFSFKLFKVQRCYQYLHSQRAASHRQVHVDPGPRQADSPSNYLRLSLRAVDLVVYGKLRYHPGKPPVQETPRYAVQPWCRYIRGHKPKKKKKKTSALVGTFLSQAWVSDACMAWR